MAGRQRGEHEVGVELFEPVALRDQHPASPRRGRQSDRSRRPARQAGKPLSDPPLIDRAHRHQQEVVGGEALAVEADQVGGRQPLHHLAPAEDRAGQRMGTPAGRERLLGRHLDRGVLDQVELCGHHPPLQLEFVRPQSGAKHRVQHELERLVEALRRDVRGDRARFAGGEGIDVPAERVDQLRDRLRSPVTAPAQQQVLQEMGDAGDLRPSRVPSRCAPRPPPPRFGRAAWLRRARSGRFPSTRQCTSPGIRLAVKRFAACCCLRAYLGGVGAGPGAWGPAFLLGSK